MLISRALEVLGLSNESILNAQSLKRAYRTALLAAHPDKQPRHSMHSSTTQDSIDVVREAYLVLLGTLKTFTSPSTNKFDKEDEKRGYSVVDLDDFEYDSTDEWTLDCRCGHAYRVTEQDLEQGRDVVGCDGCSLFVRITYQENHEDD